MKIQNELEGFYQFETVRLDSDGNEIPGTRRVVAPWFPNLILNGGLERFGSASDTLERCQVGAGGTAPRPIDTSLGSLVASSTAGYLPVTGAQSSEPYFGWIRKGYRFAEGTAAGNLSEVGVGWTASGGGLFSRALILDPGGTPTTISVAADETLDVIYELRIYPPTSDATGTIELDGQLHSWTSRASQVTTSSTPTDAHTGVIVNLYPAYAYNGAISTVTGSPAGANTEIGISRVPYEANSRKISHIVSANLDQGNLSGGIKSLRLGAVVQRGCYQIEFDPPIPKNNTKVFSLTVEVTWARRP